MNADSWILGILNLACSSVCIATWFGVGAILARRNVLRKVADMQSRLQAWASEKGYRIVRQERPEKAPILSRVSMGFQWLCLSNDCPWVFGIYRRSFWKSLPTVSTCVIFEDREGRLRRGKMQYVGAQYRGFRGPVESSWKDDDFSFPPQETPSEPHHDPLWDHWMDSRGAE
jgi:hypothetical protein